MNQFLQKVYDKKYNIIDNPEYGERSEELSDKKYKLDELNRRKKYLNEMLEKKSKGFFSKFFNSAAIEEIEKELKNVKDKIGSCNLDITKTHLELSKIPKTADKIDQFIKELKNTSPSYDMLMEMDEFIRYASIIWFYNNSEDSEMYTLPQSTGGRKYHAHGFVVKDSNGLYTITVRLLDGEIVKLTTKNNKSSDEYTYHFKNNDWDMDYDIADEMGLEYAQNLIMKAFVKVFMYCYNLK